MKKPPACVQCRKRKIGCDRQKPICGNCLRNGKNDCFFPDVPGVYVQSSSVLAAQQGSPSSAFSSNPELASLEQIREYNSQLQLINSHQTVSPAPTEHPQFIPRVIDEAAAHVNMNMGSDDEAAPQHWVQGPAIFDLVQCPYTQEEVLNKEMDFLRSRLIELQTLTGTKIDEDLLKSTKKRKTTDSRTEQPARRTINDFQDLDPAFLNPDSVFQIFKHKSRFLPESHSKLRDKPNSLFHIDFLRIRDDFLCVFHNKVYDAMANNFQRKLSEIRGVQQSIPQPFNKEFNLRLPSADFITIVLKKFMSQVDTTLLIPILKPNELLAHLHSVSGTPQNLSQLLIVGKISIALLLAYHALASSVLIPLKDENLAMFQKLQVTWVPILKENVTKIRQHLLLRPPTIAISRYIALWKYYQMLSTDASPDLDEDVHLALNFGLNQETQDQELVLLWNFIYKNYCWRHLARGELPHLVCVPSANTTPELDPLLSNNSELIKFEIELLKYLHSKSETLSVEKIKAYMDDFKNKLAAVSQRCVNSYLVLSCIVDSLIYRNAQLFLQYYVLLHYESVNNSTQFSVRIKEFLQFLQETVFYIFSGLANIKFAGYEFMFIKYSFNTLYNLCCMIFALLQRSQINSNAEVEQQREMFFLLLRKISMLLTDYAKNCRAVDPLVNRITNAIVVMLEAAHQEHAQPRGTPQLPMNGFKYVEPVTVQKNVAKLRIISESLIKTDFYNQREPFTSRAPTTCGITDDNFFNAYYAFFD